MTLLREAIGDSLRRARLAQHRTLREVSTSARVSLGYLSEVERGRKEASSELLAAICQALDVPLSRVLWDVSTVMAGGDAEPVAAEPAVPEPAAPEPAAPEPAIPDGPAAPAVAAPEVAEVGAVPAPAGMAAIEAAVRSQIDEDTRIVIPAPTADMLVLVKSN
ncbi:MAG TPA: helix-turn-helix transcriptional regulator [Nocardia sp.]|nr:helix-turn-helix transcriptional regulator [Nocardia sp.]HLS78787.1 helix-turn-helix transcriptional regulator [Nocardia sp.]